MNYSTLSVQLTKKLDKKLKKKEGIFFTPPKTIEKNLNYLKPFFKTIQNVLEPSCGSCEYILKIHKKIPHCNITGIEKNKTIYNKIKQFNNDKIKIYNYDFLEWNTKQTFDLIIGNPPYLVITREKSIRKYDSLLEGRPNLFILFLLKSLDLLNKNGVLSFILPTNFNNCLYYNKVREYIIQHFKILHLEYCSDSYLETKQNTILFIVQKKNGRSSNFFLNKYGFTIFGSKSVISQLKQLYKNSKSLYELGCNVKVGSITWNKEHLTNDNTKTRLIYDTDIGKNTLTQKHYKNKSNFILRKGESKPIIIINRGYGLCSYKFNYYYIKKNEFKQYLLENHILFIECSDTSVYPKIIKSFQDKKTLEFISIFFANNAINTTELKYLFPIYL